MMKESELKRCPFCGGEANLVKVRSGKSFRYAPGCTTDKCMGHWWVTGKGFCSEEEAIKSWNMRNNEIKTSAWEEDAKIKIKATSWSVKAKESVDNE